MEDGAGAPPLVPAFDTFHAPAHWRAIDILSDLHLNAAMPRTFSAWAGHLRRTDADAVFILGDLFELWVGDDARDLPFERRCVETLAQAAAARCIGFMPGNRDFLVGEPMRNACGLRALADPTLVVAWGRRALLTHGDALCLADHDYQRFRRVVRDAAWQADFLALPLPQRQRIAAATRSESQARQRFDGLASVDIDVPASLAWLDAADADVLVHGHTHRPGSQSLEPGRERQVLSDWDLEVPATARAEVLRWTPGGFSRIPPTTA